jgi:hypothetical protein
MTVRDEDLNRLWDQNRIAIHFSGDSEKDSESLNPDNYTRNSEKRAIKTLVELAANGGYVWADSRGQTNAKVGLVKPRTEVQLASATYTKPSDPRYEGREGTEAVLKTLQLDRGKEVKPHAAMSLRERNRYKAQ